MPDPQSRCSARLADERASSIRPHLPVPAGATRGASSSRAHSRRQEAARPAPGRW
jgi:hypothetical protein